MSVRCWFHSSSNEYQAAQANLARSFQGKFDRIVVPCVVASGDIKDRKELEPLSFRCGVLVTEWGVILVPPLLLVRPEAWETGSP